MKTNAKQDRQGVRTASQLEQKYDLSDRDYDEIRELAVSAQRAAEKASRDIGLHNISESAHEDIRKRIQTLEENKGGDGSYYTPVVTQTTDTTMIVAYTPSESTMPSVAPVTVNLPQGAKGDKGDKGDPCEKGEPGSSADIEVLTIEEIRAICT
jgi:hypothetical protein